MTWGCIHVLDVIDGDGLPVFPNKYGFGGGVCGYDGVGFLCWTIFDIICGVAKGRVHGVGGRPNVFVGFFKTEGGGCHETINRCSGKKIIRLGSCCCYSVWFYEILSLRYLKFFSVVFISVLSCLWRFYNLSTKVISCPCILSIPIKILRLVHIPVEWLWLVHSKYLPNTQKKTIEW